MKIVHLIDYFQPKIGYQEYFLAQEHQKFGHETLVVTSNRYYPFPHYDTTYKSLLGPRYAGSGRIKEMEIDTFRLKSIEIPKTNLVILQGLKKAIFSFKPDLTICHGVYSLTSYFAAILKEKIGYKLIYDTHAASFNTNFGNSLPKRIYHFFYHKFLAPQILKNKDAIFAIGDAEQQFICHDFHLPKNKIPIIRLGVDITLFSYNEKERFSIRNRLKIKREEIVIIYAGKITPNKDLHILYKALRLLDNQKIRFLVVGGGNNIYIRELKKLCLTNTLWIPFVENKVLPDYYSASDIGVWPGDFSSTILEAMSCGLPVIVPQTDAHRFLGESSSVLNFPRGNYKELSGELSKLIQNDKLRRDLGDKAKTFIGDNLSWENIAKAVISLVFRI